MQPRVAGAVKAGDRDVDGPVLTKVPFRVLSGVNSVN